MSDANGLKIWHKGKHDDFTVTEVDCASGVSFTVRQMQREGGWWINEDEFIPWHSISYIQVQRPPKQS